MIRAGVLVLGIASALTAGWITLEKHHEARLDEAALAVRTHNFDGTVRGRLDPYFKARAVSGWTLTPVSNGLFSDTVRVELAAGEQRAGFEVNDGNVTPIDAESKALATEIRVWANAKSEQ